MIQVLLIFIFAHFLCDFVTQTGYMIERKNRYKKVFSITFNIGLTEHIIHHIIVTFMLLMVFSELNYSLVISSIIIAIVHYLVDLLKVNFAEETIHKMKGKPNHEKNIVFYLLEKNSFYFLGDQLLHLLTIYTVLFLFDKVYAPNKMVNVMKDFFFYDIPMNEGSKIVLLGMLLVLLTFGSGYLIASFLKDIKQKKLVLNDEIAAAIEEDKLHTIYSTIGNMEKNLLIEQAWEVEEKDPSSKKSIKIQFQNFNEIDNSAIGKWIGVLERFLIAMFIVLQAYQGLVLLAAFKTLTRFKQFDDKSFAEYYLIGTLLSIVLGIIFGELIKKVFIL